MIQRQRRTFQWHHASSDESGFRSEPSQVMAYTRTVSRREFLIRSVGFVVVLPTGVKLLGLLDHPTTGSDAGLSRDNLLLLAAAMDEIIPQNDGMPSAS